MFYVKRRSQELSAVKAIVFATLLSIVIMFTGISVILVASGFELKDLIERFLRPENLISSTVIRYTIITTILSLALLVNVSGGFINLGAEGQIMFSMLAILIASVYGLGIFLAFVISIALVMIWMLIPYLVKIYLEGSDVLVSFIQNFIALFIANHIVTHVFRGELARPRSPPIDPSINLHYIFSSQSNVLYDFLGRISIESLVLVLVAMILLSYFINRSRIGISMRLLSHSVKTAAISGVNIPRYILLNLLIASFLITFASAELLLGGERRIFYNDNARIGVGSMSFGIGYVALSIAILSTARPYMTIIYSYIFSLGLMFVFSSYGFYSLILNIAIIGLSLLAALVSELFLRYEVRITWWRRH